MTKPHKVRNHILNDGVAENRYEIYKKAIEKYNLAFEKGFYFEAIAIVESLIADRMESRLGELSKEEVEFNTLSNLKDRLNGKTNKYPRLEDNIELINTYNKIVSDWAGKRNKALHQIAKISMAESKDWDEFNLEAKSTAEEGKKWFYLLNKLIQKERRNNKK